MHVNNTRSIIAGLLLLVLFVTVSCAQEAIVRDPVPEVKVSRSNFIRGIIDATSSGMITDEVKTAIKLSVIDTGETVPKNAHILTLSTCEKGDRRFVVMGYR